jgi:integrase
VRLTQATCRELWRLRKEFRASDGDLVFTAERGGRLVHGNLLGRVLKPAAVEAGLAEWVQTEKGRKPESWVGCHTFRHTCATILFRRGWNAPQVQRFLGHSDPAFTLRGTYICSTQTFRSHVLRHAGEDGYWLDGRGRAPVAGSACVADDLPEPERR